MSAHHKHEALRPLRLGSKAHLMALEGLRVFDALLCSLSLISILSNLIQNET